MKIKDIKKKAIISLLTLSEVLALNGCAKKVDCDIEGDHVHIYKTEEGLEMYSSIEKTYLGGFNYQYNRTDDYKYVSSLEEKYYDYLNKKSLISIDDNYEVLNYLFPKLPSYMEYEYKWYQPVTHHTYDSKGNISSTYITYEVRYSWTTDPNHSSLTGDERLITYAYSGYKVYYDDNKRKYYSEESPYYRTLDELIDAGYYYCKTNNFREEIDDKYIEKSSILSFK